jgi:acetyl-CoA synthase
MIEKSLHLRGISLEGTRGPDIPVSYCATYEDEPSAGESCARLDVSFGLVLARKVAYVKDHAVSVIGPDISAEGAALPLGIIAEIYGHRMKSEYEAVIEKNIPRWLSRAEGITYAASETKGACIRIGRQAFNRGMRVAHLGEIIYAGIKSDYEAVADKCAVTLVTDGKTVQTLKNDAAQPKYAMRRALRPPQDTYACTLCKKIARGCGCTVTQYKPGACAAVTLQDAKLFSETMRTSVKKLDSADEAVYSVCAGQKTGFGGFTCVSAVIPKAKGVIVLDDAYTGDTPLKLKYCEIAAQTDGAFSTPGYMGHCKEFIASEKYMAPEGGLARIVWMPKALKETLREKIDETARALYGIQNFSDMICDETVTTESETLIDFLVKENHPVIGMDELI